MKEDKRFAVLIDADNVSEKYIKLIFDEISNYGVITYKRIYGDWTMPTLSSWKSSLLRYSITPIQHTAIQPEETQQIPPSLLMPWIYCTVAMLRGSALYPVTATLQDLLQG